MKNENIMYNAVLSHFEAERQKAIANLSVYFSNPVGIGEHGDVVTEMINLTRKLADADGCIDSLNRAFVTKEDEQIINS